jgi:hypothetical protein
MMLAVVGFVGLLVGALIVFVVLDRARKQWIELEKVKQSISSDRDSLAREQAKLDTARSEFERRYISYGELEQENLVLKRDLRNIDVTVQKQRLDHQQLREQQAQLGLRSHELAQRYLTDVEKWVTASISANNYAACKQRLEKAINWCREIGFDVSADREIQLITELKLEYERAVRAAIEREEQARIKARIREEQHREREIQRALQSAEREQAAIRSALDTALARSKEEHSAEIEQLRLRLAEAEERAKRTTSQAQLTRAGNIYVISNIGSFGDGVFKIGMTRRLEPMDRISELGDASVPFGFDVHMMIACEDAPSLESALHKQFHKHRLNKINPRKEFFRIDLDSIAAFVQQHHGKVEYVADAEALEYRQSITMTDADEEYVDAAFEKAQESLGIQDTEE